MEILLSSDNGSSFAMFRRQHGSIWNGQAPGYGLESARGHCDVTHSQVRMDKVMRGSCKITFAALGVGLLVIAGRVGGGVAAQHLH